MGYPKQPGQDNAAHLAVTYKVLELTRENKALKAQMEELEEACTQAEETVLHLRTSNDYFEQASASSMANSDSLRLELAALEHNRIKDNEFLIGERDAARDELEKALTKSAIDQAQCDDMTQEAGRLAIELKDEMLRTRFALDRHKVMSRLRNKALARLETVAREGYVTGYLTGHNDTVEDHATLDPGETWDEDAGLRADVLEEGSDG